MLINLGCHLDTVLLSSFTPSIAAESTDACSRVQNAEMVPHFLLVEEIINIPGRKIAAGSLGAIVLFYSYCPAGC